MIDILKALPAKGEEWCLKSRPTRICTIEVVRIDDADRRRGHVMIRAFWMQEELSGRSLDIFLKRYRKV